MSNSAVSAIIVVAALALLAGCYTTPTTGSSPGPASPGTIGTQYPGPEPVVIADQQKETVDDSYPGLKRVIASKYLLDSVKVIDPKIGEKGNFARAQVTVENLTQDRYELEYQYQWVDLDGFAVGNTRPWQRFALGPKELRNIYEMALEQGAKKAIFTVRLVDDSPYKENYPSDQPNANQYNQPGSEAGKSTYYNQ